MKKSLASLGSSSTGSRRYVLPLSENSAAPGTGCSTVVPTSVVSTIVFCGTYGIQFDVKGLCLRRLSIHEQFPREALLGRQQLDGFATKPQHAEVRRRGAGEMHLIVRSRPEGVIAGLQPLEPCEREPPVRLGELGD